MNVSKHASSLRQAIIVTSGFVLVLWLIELADFGLDLGLAVYGVLPRTEQGLTGILLAPMIHGSWEHIVSNTLPLLLLGSILIYGYPRSRVPALMAIWLISGAGVWLFGRTSYHFGASGLTHGMFFYLFVSGMLRRDRRSVALLMIAFFMYGGMLLTIFPGEPGVSFEYHLFGALGGLLAAIVLRRHDPPPKRKRYSWEESDDDDSQPH
ncbi:rhomboid family intramembrane serine protease [Pseudomaricurvus alkylphenolicus]|uniref:rhomboid family intramembrane serine protease n=1 Tax=Pseudomaricurvus alkylphenolicus TaxID=1306991 RepID=UPI001421526C|nr:rhomboid family intramembrane serine protease [Pseudomaricurvus alkylphenolicus]NIB42578.1 rhomboid family intramembrane serine protease [Pseudomaricurvus alkylphenolicus]